MVLLIHKKEGKKGNDVKNLHSTMVLLIPCHTFFLNLHSIIYIPLWFFSYPDKIIYSCHTSLIYIPLWFFSYRNATYTSCQVVAYLHSTMVLLIQDRFVLLGLSSPLFTFHYGSSHTFPLLPSEFSFSEFTFHYGSSHTFHITRKNFY